MNNVTNNLFFKNSTSFTKYTKKTSSTKKSKRPISIRRSMSTTSYLMRLAQAKTPTQAAAVAAIARADAQAVKQVSTSDSDIAKAKQIAKAVEKQVKIKSGRLRRENQLAMQAKVELSAKKLERAKITTEKLVKKRRARKSEERAAVLNSISSDNRHKKWDDDYGDHQDTTHIDTYVDDTLTCAAISDTASCVSDIAATAIDCIV